MKSDDIRRGVMPPIPPADQGEPFWTPKSFLKDLGQGLLLYAGLLPLAFFKSFADVAFDKKKKE
jgi:hypothetical protein